MAGRRIVLVRHAKPKIEERIPSADWTLSDEGAVAAGALGEKLRVFGFARALSSPEPKAIATAEAIAARLDVPVVVADGLAEQARRSVGFLPQAEIDAGISALFANPDRVVFGDESADACFARFAKVLGGTQGDVLAVTHGTILSIYVSRVCGFDPMPFWKGLGLPAAIVLEGTRFSVIVP